MSKSKPKSKFRFRHRKTEIESPMSTWKFRRNQNGISSEFGFPQKLMIEIRIKFRRYFNFVERKKRLSWKPDLAGGLIGSYRISYRSYRKVYSLTSNVRLAYLWLNLLNLLNQPFIFAR
jgi:hypothetical protein